MNKTEATVLYEIMCEKYSAWANYKRPDAGKMGPMSLKAHDEYLTRLGCFRAREWKEYVQARDEYEKAAGISK